MCLGFQLHSIAQKWTTNNFEADELKGVSAYTSHCYEDEKNNSFIFWTNSDYNFRIVVATGGIFDYRRTTLGPSVYKTIDITVGFYDIKDNLIDKKKITMDVDDNSTFASRPWNHKNGKKVLKYLMGNQGYIRIIAPLYAKNIPFDIKVPCLQN